YFQTAFVTKLDPTGSALVYSTYLGGTQPSVSVGIAVDAEGSAYVTGYTQSSNFPTTADAFQPVPGATRPAAFVTKLDASGSALAYSTYLNGSVRGPCCGDGDIGLALAVDADGSAYVTGSTSSQDFPTTAGVFQPNLPG